MTVTAREGLPSAAFRARCSVTAADIAAYRAVARAGISASSPPRPADQTGPEDRVPTASPVHPFVLAWHSFDRLVTARAVVHLSQEVHQRRPLRADEQVDLELDLVGARSDRRGTRLALRAVLTGDDGVPFAELVTGLLLIGADEPPPFGTLPPHPVRGGGPWAEVITREVPPDLPRGYAEVSGDHNPIHLDADAARDAGFPGIIAHGMSVMARAGEEVIARHGNGDAGRVRSIGGRFASPVLPGEPLDVCLRPPDEAGVVHFCCKTPRGTAVKNGWVALATDDDQEGRP